MSEKKVHRFEYTWQGQLFGDLLDHESIEYSFINVPREYASIVAGGYTDPIDVYVDERNLDRAKQLFLQFTLESEKNKTPVEELSEINYFKRVIVFSLAGVCILPILLNWAATANFLKLSTKPISSGKKIFALFIMVLCWIIALGEAYYLLRFTKN